MFLERNEAQRHGKISGYIPNDALIVLAEELLEAFGARAGEQLELFTGSSESIRDYDSPGPAD